MRTIVSRVCARALIAVVAAAASVSPAAAQTTVTFNDSKPDVVYATLRAGAYADKNLPTVLTTRAADTASNHRRALLKFDTHHRIPAGSSVASALLTVTVKSGSAADHSRTIGAYQVTTSWAETETTWNRRRTSSGWMTGGGDLGALIAKQIVSDVAGTKITFDVTPLVRSAVAGRLGASRYTRIALVDLDPATVDSTRNFYTPDDTNGALRPTLRVVYGATTRPTTPADPRRLRVLQWNSQHGGVGTDGKADIDRFVKKAASFRPDIVSINEVERYDSYANYDAPVKIAALMEHYTGQTWHYKFVTNDGSASGRGNLILSRIPFVSSGSRLLNRGVVVDAVIDFNGRSIDFMSTHLAPTHPYYNSTALRLDQIRELTSWAKGLPEARIIAGDFNAFPGSAETAAMKAAFVDSWAQAQSEGTAIAYPGNTTGKTRHSRIDYIYYSKGATALDLVSVQVFDVRDANGVMPSDHRPVMAIFTVK